MIVRSVVLVMLLFGAACAREPQPSGIPRGAERIVDLSHEYAADAIFWPTAEGFKLEVVNDGMTPQGYYYAANNFSGAEHGGTHLDAPVHFAKGRMSVEQIPLDQLVGAAAVVDVSTKVESAPDYQVTVAELQAWEQAHGPLTGLSRDR